MTDEEAEGSRILFSSTGRSLVDEDEIVVLSVGVDIGSSTSHLVFSRIVLERLDSRYVVSARETFYQSEILLTPYAAADEIDPLPDHRLALLHLIVREVVFSDQAAVLLDRFGDLLCQVTVIEAIGIVGNALERSRQLGLTKELASAVAIGKRRRAQHGKRHAEDRGKDTFRGHSGIPRGRTRPVTI